MRTVRQDRGASTATATPHRIGITADPKAIGWRPENGKSHAQRAITATGGRPRAYAAGRRPPSQSAAATTPRNRPATGLDRVARAENATARAPRGTTCRRSVVRHRSGQAEITATAASPNMVPRP
jgi:hypothetical protein